MRRYQRESKLSIVIRGNVPKHIRRKFMKCKLSQVREWWEPKKVLIRDLNCFVYSSSRLDVDLRKR